MLISHGPSGVITVATKPARPGSILRTIGFGCPVLLTNATFPLTPDPEHCNANYTETKVGRRTTINPWPGNASPPVTTVQGEFNGTATAGQ